MNKMRNKSYLLHKAREQLKKIERNRVIHHMVGESWLRDETRRKRLLTDDRSSPWPLSRESPYHRPPWSYRAPTDLHRRAHWLSGSYYNLIRTESVQIMNMKTFTNLNAYTRISDSLFVAQKLVLDEVRGISLTELDLIEVQLSENELLLKIHSSWYAQSKYYTHYTAYCMLSYLTAIV